MVPDPITFNALSWVCGKFADKAFSCIAKDKKLQENLDKAISEWAKSLKEKDLYLEPKALFPSIINPFRITERPEYYGLQHMLLDNQLPPIETWHKVFMESWHDVKKSNIETQSFFNIPEEKASEELYKLAEITYKICLQSEQIFKMTVINQLEKINKRDGEKKQNVFFILKTKYTVPETYLLRKACNKSEYISGKHLYFLDKNAKDVLNIISDCKRIALISDAGMGKTIELQRIAGTFSQDDTPFYPFMIKLNKYVDQSISEFLPCDWDNIPKNNVLIILDGLDEIESKNINNAIRHIELFSEQYPEVHMIISCRTNFYNSETKKSSGTLDGFSSYILLELSQESIQEYITGILNKEAEEFNKDISIKRLYDLLKIPFYLISLTELFQKNHSLPNNKADLFEQLLRSRIDQDIEHSRTTKKDFKKKQNIIIDTLQIIALGMETLGRNYITEDEYYKIVEDESIRELIECCASWRKDDSDGIKWQFEHNNFQEYLAAKSLSMKSLPVIKEFMYFGPDYKKLIPSWSNTLSFLISIYDEHNLISWIIENEPELTIKFEPDKLEEIIRIKIFKEIFNYYKEKQIWINHDKFKYDELARFGQSDEIVRFLLKEAQQCQHYTTCSNIIELLSNLEIPYNQKELTKQLLIDYAIRNNFNNQVQNRALMALADLKMNSLDVIERITSSLRTSENEWIRYALYYLLHNSDYLEKYIDIFLEGIKLIRMNLSSTRSRLMDEGLHLRIGLEKAKSPDSVSKILDYFINNPNDFRDSLFDNSVSVIAENATYAYENNPSILQNVRILFEVLINQYLEKYAQDFVIFFNKTKTRFHIFKEYLFQDNDKIDRWNILAMLADMDCINFFIQQYQYAKLDDNDVITFRNFLAYKQYKLSSEFNLLINEYTGNKFPLPTQRDYQKERKGRIQKDFNMLFDKQVFLKEIKLIFDTEKKDKFNIDDIFKIQSSHWDNPYFSDLAISQLRDLAKGNVISYENVIEDINNWNWSWFCIFNVYEILTNNEDILPSQDQREWIKQWCYSNIDIVDFKTAIKIKSKDSFSTSCLCIFLWYFLRKYNLSYPKAILLDMLSFDYFDEGGGYIGIDYLEPMLPKHEIIQRVFENLREGIEIDNIMKNHLLYCLKYNLVDVLPFAIQEIINQKRGNELREVALKTVSDLSKSSVNDLENILQNIKDDFKWYVVEKLVQNKSSVCHKYLLTMLHNGNDEEKLKSSEYLMELREIEGLKFYVSWIRKNKKYPETRYHDKSPLLQLWPRIAVPYLIELLQIRYEPNYIQHNFDYLENYVLYSLTTIGLQSESEYEFVRNAIDEFINENVNIIPNVNFLNIYLEKFDQRYYISKSETLQIDDVIAKLNKI